ncbi:MAG TPA: L-threonylcarbamoyladenylate synthase [Thermoanaerobaculia bacterium]|jgi:L-threonylcarbamoyladenylate synthase|nr:L-threonylcarbamoyladenylate synthase [Thermoanaerobaculia bacterium]
MSGDETVGALRWHFGDPVEELIALRARGGVIAFPTESSYGLGVDPSNAAAVAEVERIKRRSTSKTDADAEPAGKPMPVVIAGLDQLSALGIDADSAPVRRFAALWPAPLTAVLPLGEGTDISAARGSRTLAVRIPDHPELRALLAAIGPLTATSANRTGEPPLLSASAVAALLEEAGIADAAVVAGEAPGGPPSTLAALDGDRIRILRQGPFPAERLLVPGESSPSSRGDS